MKIDVEKVLFGSNPMKYVTKIETHPYDAKCEVFIDNPENNTKARLKLNYEKFVFVRDLDLLPDFLKENYLLAKESYDAVVKERGEATELEKEVYTLIEDAKELRKEIKDIKKAYEAIDMPPKVREELQEMNSRLQSMNDIREGHIDTINKIDKNVDFLEEKYNDASEALRGIDSFPRTGEFKTRIAEYNAMKRLTGDKAITITPLHQQVDHKRIKFGYCYKVSTKGKYGDLRNALEHAGLPISGNGEQKKVVRAAGVVESVRLTDQAYISTGIRNFNGLDIETIHAVHYDLETTSLYPGAATCFSCRKKYELSSKLDMPQRCSNKVKDEYGEMGYCNSHSFEYSETGQIFMIAIKDSRHGNSMLYAEKAEDGTINRESEKKLIEDFFKYISKHKPSIVVGYNVEGFDSGYLITRAEDLGVSLAAAKCINCKTGYYHIDGDKWQCDECSHIITKESVGKYRNDPRSFANDYNLKCPSCDDGYIIAGKTMYGCSNHKRCDHRESFSYGDRRIRDTLRSVANYTPSSHDVTKPFSKTPYESSLKLGADVIYYKATQIYGANSMDTWFAVQRAKAINSSIGSTSLKYVERYIAKSNKESILNKRSRTYIPHAKINDMYTDRRYFVVNKRNIYKETVGDPKAYYETFMKEPHRLPDYDKPFVAPNPDFDKDTDYSKADVFSKGASTTMGMEQTLKIPDILDESGEFRLMSGKELVEQYAYDDVIGEREAFMEFAKERFLTVAYFPTTLERFATMGVASAWNLMTVALCYEHNIAIPHRTVGRIAVGGLSRMWVRGFMENIQKMDFSSLYPTIQLDLDVFPEFAPYMEDLLKFFFDMRMYHNARKKTKTPEQLLGFLKEDGSPDIDKVAGWIASDKEEDKKVLADYMKKYKANADNIQLPCKININGIFGFISSMVGLCGDLVKGCQITASGRMFLRGVVAFMGHFGFKPLVCDTDGVNFSNPDLIKHSIEDFTELETPIRLDEVEWKGKNGMQAFLKRYNELMLPETGYMELSDDGTWVNCFNAAKKNYINLEDDGSVKMTGNSFKSSNNISLVDIFFKKEVAETMKTQNLDHLTKEFNRYCKLIKDGKAQLRHIVKKSRNKTGYDEYLNRGYDKNGKEKARQAHMELQIAQGVKVEQGKVIYYVNNGLSASHGDADMVKIYEEQEKSSHRCMSCNKTTVGKPDSCTAKIKEKCGRTHFSEIAKGLWQCDHCGTEYQRNSAPKKCTHVVSENVCGCQDYEEMAVIECANCQKEHNISFDRIDRHGDPLGGKEYFTIDGGQFTCGKRKSGVKCECDNFYPVRTRICIGERNCSYIVGEDDLAEKGTDIVEYNRKHYYKLFCNKFEPFKFLYPKHVRDVLIPSFDEKPKLRGNEGFEMSSEPLDSIEESLTLEQKEVDFWNESGLNPLELLPYFHESINILSDIPKWDDFNRFCTDMERKKKSKDPNFALKRSRRFAKPGEIYATRESADVFKVWKNDEEPKLLATWDNINKKFK